MVREIPDRMQQETTPELAARFALRASVLTAGSKATVVTDSVEIDTVALNHHLEVIETQAFNFAGLESYGKELAQLVLPSLVRQALREMQEHHLVVINDARTSRIPWETINLDNRFPAGEVGLSRKYEAENLTVAKWLEERRLERELKVLLIVNPTRDLAGAEAEGNRVKDILLGKGEVKIKELWREQATFGAIRAAFRSGEFDVVHYAGHAFFDPLNRARSGIVCHGHQVLSGNDLAGLERLPALVFFNACEAGRVRGAPARVRSRSDRDGGRNTAKRLETNVGFAEALLRAGVGNYIGTYWPVGDDSAKAFGETFYEGLIKGKSLGLSMTEARKKVQELQSEDWADYILYGSPEFVLKLRP
jgi:CHAT domain-containing protein